MKDGLFCRSSVPFWHPRITSSYQSGIAAPSAHPSINGTFSGASRGAISSEETQSPLLG